MYLAILNPKSMIYRKLYWRSLVSIHVSFLLAVDAQLLRFIHGALVAFYLRKYFVCCSPTFVTHRSFSPTGDTESVMPGIRLGRRIDGTISRGPISTGSGPPERAETPRTKSRPAFERAQRAIKALYPNDVPDQVTEPNAALFRRVSAKLTCCVAQ